MSSRASLADLSVVIPSWNTRERLAHCLRHLADAQRRGVELIVVDDASSDGSAECVAGEFEHVLLLCNEENLGFAASVNRGARRASRRWLLLLNADTEVLPGALETLLAFLASHPEYAAAAPRLLDWDGSTQASCMAFPGWATPLFFGTPLERIWPESRELRRYFLRSFDHRHDADVLQPPAAALLIARKEFSELGGLDESLPLFFNDVDLCRRLAARKRPIRFLADATVRHEKGASTRQLDDFASRWHRDRLTYYRKHHGALAGAWVKLCTTATVFDHLLRGFGRRVLGRRSEPLVPLVRAFGTYLRS